MGRILEIMASNSDVSSHLRYKDKVAIVTGGSKGIGEGCVRVFGKFYQRRWKIREEVVLVVAEGPKKRK